MFVNVRDTNTKSGHFLSKKYGNFRVTLKMCDFMFEMVRDHFVIVRITNVRGECFLRTILVNFS